MGESGNSKSDELAQTLAADPLAATASSAREVIKERALDGTRVGRYILDRKLGAGGMGAVYAARDPELDRVIAIKLLHADLADQRPILLREGQAIAKLRHPNVVTVYDIGTSDDALFIAMEYVEGGTLRTWRDATSRSEREILDAYLAAGRGLVAAHAVGLVHRDFKPDNVLTGTDGRVVVTDFGLAREMRRADVLTSLAASPVDVTQTATVMGTPAYMSPEQFRANPLDARSDQFSFCVALFEALYGKRPFAGATFFDLQEAVIDGRLEAPEKVASPKLHAALLKGMATNRDARWSSMDALLRELAPRASRQKMFAITAVVIALAGTAVAGVLLPRGTAPADTCATQQIAAAWNATRRDALVTRFAAANGPDITAVERLLLKELDGYATQWSKQWDAACVAPDRDSAPLIFAQRENCLARALIDFTAITDAVRDVDVSKFARSYIGESFGWTTPLSDCKREETLRALPPAPPRDRTAEVTASIRRIHTARSRAREILNGRMPGSIDEPLSELDAVIAHLDGLGVATAAEAAMIHAHYLSFAVTIEPARADAAQRSIDRAFTLARKYRYDRVLADDYHVAIRYEVAHGKSIPKLREWVAQLDEAYERAGHPNATRSGAGGRGELALLEGDFETASRSFEAALKDLGPGFGEPPMRLRLVLVQGYLGRHDDAIATAREGLRRAIDDWGPDNRNTLQPREFLSIALERAGRFSEARDELDKVLRIGRSIGVQPSEGNALRNLALVDILGPRAERDAALEAIPARPGVDRWLLWSDFASNNGRFDLARELTKRSTDALAPFLAAGVVAVRGDDAGAIALVDSVPAKSADAIEIRAFVHALTDAHANHVAPVETRLAKSAARYGGPHDEALPAMTDDLYLLVALHRWDAARELGARLYAFVPEFANNPGVTATVESLFGRALLETNDFAMARPHLERALFTMQTAPVDAVDIPDTALALARVLIATKGDVARVRSLGQLAIANYGPFRAVDRDAAQRWLDGLAK